MPTILIVDDTTENRKVLAQLLKNEGYTVRAASNGRLALDSCDAAPPDLILLDISMPEMDGFEVCKALKEKAVLKHIPIIFLSARTQSNDKVAAFEAGGVDYISKPFEPMETLSRVRTHLRIAQLQRELESMNDTLEERVRKRTRELEVSMEKLRQAEKMELVGRLAGGVAHDFNNLLTCILGYVELAKIRLKPEPAMQRYLDDIELATRRSADLTHQLLAFARKQIIQPRQVNLNQCIIEAERLLRRTLGEQIELVSELSPVAPLALVDPGQMSQVIINMGINARDAMPNGGRLTLKAGFATLDEHALKDHPDVRPGRYTLLTIRDTGTGIAKDNQKRIFEPFFTTKQPGKGTGLGLATCYGIIKQHNGHLSLESSSAGTTFFIYLPTCEQLDVPQIKNVLAPAPSSTAAPTVLLCDDDKRVREVINSALSSAGYKVLPASNAAMALQLAQDSTEPIALLITDLVMPSMSGLELERKIRERLPHLKVLFITGYSEQAISPIDKTRQLLQKPFSPRDLFQKVRAMLEEE